MSAFDLKGAEATTAVEITPLGVGLVGALLLSWCFLRSLRTAPGTVTVSELLVRAGAVVGLFVAVLGGLAWAGHDVVTLDVGSPGLAGLDRLPGGGGGPGPGDLGGLLSGRIGGLVRARASVGFGVDTVPTLLGAFVWIGPSQGAGSGAVHRKAEEGVMAEPWQPTTTPRGAVPDPASPA